jgi:hypothetical protein
VEAKVADFEIRGAVKLLSLLSLASFYEDVADPDPDPSKPGDISLIVNEQNVREAINSFPAGSSPGLDGMRPRYLKDIISLSEGTKNFNQTVQFVIIWATFFRNLSFIVSCVFMCPSQERWRN